MVPFLSSCKVGNVNWKETLLIYELKESSTLPVQTPPLIAKEHVDESESEKAGLKLNIQKSKIMVSSHTTSWQIDGETMETVADFIF